MLDLNSLIKQDDLNRKLTLLKQIKIVLESLMFDNGCMSARSSWQNFSGTMTIFSRHVLAILEDNIVIVEAASCGSEPYPAPFTFSPATSLSCSPIRHSRSSTNSSQGTVDSRTSRSSSNALWLFVTSVLHPHNQKLDKNEAIITKELASVEIAAKKDFNLIFNQLMSQHSTDEDNASRKLSEVSMKSNASTAVEPQANLSLEWISQSLRQNILLNQLMFLLCDESQTRSYYRKSAFVLDRSFVEDFLNYIRAYEKRDYSILSKIKRNFFSITTQPVRLLLLLLNGVQLKRPKTN